MAKKIFVFLLVILAFFYLIISFVNRDDSKEDTASTDSITAIDESEDDDLVDDDWGDFEESIDEDDFDDLDKIVTSDENVSEDDFEIIGSASTTDGVVAATSLEVAKDIDTSSDGSSENIKDESDFSKKFMVVTGSFMSEENALIWKKELQKKGISAEVVIFDFSQYHSVISGRFSDLSEAKSHQEELLEKGIEEAYVHKMRSRFFKKK